MPYTNFSEFQQSRGTTVVPGVWKLAAGHALSLRPRQPGVLRIAQGRAWVTLDVPHNGHGNESGDHLLQAGHQLEVYAGQHLVFETMERAGGTAVSFEWTPQASMSAAHALQGAAAVTQPWHELGQALGMVGSALGRLSMGLLAYGRQRMAGRVPVQVPHCG